MRADHRQAAPGQGGPEGLGIFDGAPGIRIARRTHLQEGRGERGDVRKMVIGDQAGVHGLRDPGDQRFVV